MKMLQDLRPRLEQARLELLALFRALDRLDLLPAEIPQSLLHRLFELDADFAEALWALDQPPRRLDLKAVLRDTMTSLRQLAPKRDRLLQALAPRVQARLEQARETIAVTLTADDAYLGVPGRDPGV